MVHLWLTGSEQPLDTQTGESIFDTLRRHSVPIATSCGAQATCGMCRLTVRRGREHLSPVTPEEIKHLGTVAKVIGLRLACQTRMTGGGDVEVDVPVIEDVGARKHAKADRLRRSPRS